MRLQELHFGAHDPTCLPLVAPLSVIRDEHGPEPDRSRIVMSRDCQLKYFMSYVRTFHKSLRLAVRDDTVVVVFTLQTIEKTKCAVGMQLVEVS